VEGGGPRRGTTGGKERKPTPPKPNTEKKDPRGSHIMFVFNGCDPNQGGPRGFEKTSSVLFWDKKKEFVFGTGQNCWCPGRSKGKNRFLTKKNENKNKRGGEKFGKTIPPNKKNRGGEKTPGKE